MKIGIVGAEAKKFTMKGRSAAERIIWDLINHEDVSGVCSGECPLGGIDIWAHDIADELGKPFTPFPPAENNWSNGFKPRNLQIAHWSDKVVNIVVDRLPEGFVGMTFKSCYHCAKAGRDPLNHVKSGGCWTALQAIKFGKDAEWIIINNG